MANAYSYDLRQKVTVAIELNSMKKSEAAQVFGISRNTIDLWLKRRGETGDYQAKPRQSPGNGHKITDWQASFWERGFFPKTSRRSFESLQPTTAIKLRWKWRSFGKVKSVRGRFLAPYTR